MRATPAAACCWSAGGVRIRQMQAGLLYGPGDLRVVDVDPPEPGPEDVLVRVARYAPYGTDVGTYLNRDGRYVTEYPVGVGADFSGVVEAIGEQVTGISVGDRVCALAMDHCGKCANCRRGRTNMCLDPAALSARRQVCCQTHTLVNYRKLAVLPREVTFDAAAMLTGPVTALNALELIGAEKGEAVAVVGAGVMGWGTVATALALGLNPIVIGGMGRRAELAKDLGAARVFGFSRYDEDLVPRVREALPDGFARVVETTATEWGVKQAIGVAAPGGHIAIMGGGALPASGWEIVLRELALFGVRGGAGQSAVLEMIAEGDVDLRPTITHRFPLHEAPAAFALLSGPDVENVGRVMIEIDADL